MRKLGVDWPSHTGRTSVVCQHLASATVVRANACLNTIYGWTSTRFWGKTSSLNTIYGWTSTRFCGNASNTLSCSDCAPYTPKRGERFETTTTPATASDARNWSPSDCTFVRPHVMYTYPTDSDRWLLGISFLQRKFPTSFTPSAWCTSSESARALRKAADEQSEHSLVEPLSLQAHYSICTLSEISEAGTTRPFTRRETEPLRADLVSDATLHWLHPRCPTVSRINRLHMACADVSGLCENVLPFAERSRHSGRSSLSANPCEDTSQLQNVSTYKLYHISSPTLLPRARNKKRKRETSNAGLGPGKGGRDLLEESRSIFVAAREGNYASNRSDVVALPVHVARTAANFSHQSASEKLVPDTLQGNLVDCLCHNRVDTRIELVEIDDLEHPFRLATPPLCRCTALRFSRAAAPVPASHTIPHVFGEVLGEVVDLQEVQSDSELSLRPTKNNEVADLLEGGGGIVCDTAEVRMEFSYEAVKDILPGAEMTHPSCASLLSNLPSCHRAGSTCAQEPHEYRSLPPPADQYYSTLRRLCGGSSANERFPIVKAGMEEGEWCNYYRKQLILPASGQFVLRTRHKCSLLAFVRHFQLPRYDTREPLNMQQNCELHAVYVNGWPHYVLTSVPGVPIRPGDLLLCDLGPHYFNIQREKLVRQVSLLSRAAQGTWSTLVERAALMAHKSVDALSHAKDAQPNCWSSQSSEINRRSDFEDAGRQLISCGKDVDCAFGSVHQFIHNVLHEEEADEEDFLFSRCQECFRRSLGSERHLGRWRSFTGEKNDGYPRADVCKLPRVFQPPSSEPLISCCVCGSLFHVSCIFEIPYRNPVAAQIFRDGWTCHFCLQLCERLSISRRDGGFSTAGSVLSKILGRVVVARSEAKEITRGTEQSSAFRKSWSLPCGQRQAAHHAGGEICYDGVLAKSTMYMHVIHHKDFASAEDLQELLRHLKPCSTCIRPAQKSLCAQRDFIYKVPEADSWESLDATSSPCRSSSPHLRKKPFTSGSQQRYMTPILEEARNAEVMHTGRLTHLCETGMLPSFRKRQQAGNKKALDNSQRGVPYQQMEEPVERHTGDLKSSRRNSAQSVVQVPALVPKAENNARCQVPESSQLSNVSALGKCSFALGDCTLRPQSEEAAALLLHRLLFTWAKAGVLCRLHNSHVYAADFDDMGGFHSTFNQAVTLYRLVAAALAFTRSRQHLLFRLLSTARRHVNPKLSSTQSNDAKHPGHCDRATNHTTTTFGRPTNGNYKGEWGRPGNRTDSVVSRRANLSKQPKPEERVESVTRFPTCKKRRQGSKSVQRSRKQQRRQMAERQQKNEAYQLLCERDSGKQVLEGVEHAAVSTLPHSRKNLRRRSFFKDVKQVAVREGDRPGHYLPQTNTFTTPCSTAAELQQRSNRAAILPLSLAAYGAPSNLQNMSLRRESQYPAVALPPGAPDDKIVSQWLHSYGGLPLKTCREASPQSVLQRSQTLPEVYDIVIPSSDYAPQPMASISLYTHPHQYHRYQAELHQRQCQYQQSPQQITQPKHHRPAQQQRQLPTEENRVTHYAPRYHQASGCSGTLEVPTCTVAPLPQTHHSNHTKGHKQQVLQDFPQSPDEAMPPDGIGDWQWYPLQRWESAGPQQRQLHPIAGLLTPPGPDTKQAPASSSCSHAQHTHSSIALQSSHLSEIQQLLQQQQYLYFLQTSQKLKQHPFQHQMTLRDGVYGKSQRLEYLPQNLTQPTSFEQESRQVYQQQLELQLPHVHYKSAAGIRSSSSFDKKALNKTVARRLLPHHYQPTFTMSRCGCRPLTTNFRAQQQVFESQTAVPEQPPAALDQSRPQPASSSAERPPQPLQPKPSYLRKYEKEPHCQQVQLRQATCSQVPFSSLRGPVQRSSQA